ncbi:MAG TPA: UvrB/UvrC motif-containing protein [Longimicrobiales bacterium]|nr:UvrB/UvrC motif-containing protein [Longimicrobiales bacterium]
MLCENCGEKNASIHYTQIEKNEMQTFHLCEDCAATKGLQPGVNIGDFPLTDFLAQMGRAGAESAVPAPCAFCGLTLEDFRKTGRLGCSHCYVTFENHLSGLLRRLHGGTQHVGKVYLPPNPSESARSERLAGLRRKLDHAVQSEDFERAARIRDQIRAMEGAL